jgi:hypothetical protein
MLRFTGQTDKEAISVQLPYRATCDEELTLALADAITALARAIAEARRQDISTNPDNIRWMKEFLLGFALLATGEARSIVMLLSDNLGRHARVHVRSLFEYELRAKLLTEDPDRALAFRDSIAFEMRKVGGELGKQGDAIEREIAATLGVNDAFTIIGAKESEAFGGTVRQQMKGEVWPEKRYYGSFAGLSWISHGSVLSLRELAKAVDGVGADLLRREADDGNGNDWLHHAAWITLKFACWIQDHFGVPVPTAGVASARIIAANKRLKVISEAQEKVAIDALKAHSEGKSL